jgi:ATP-dependent protease ClpP protease subunit
MKRDELLSDFRLLAAAHYGGQIDPSLESLLAKLVIDIPDSLMPKTPLSVRNTVYIIGEITEASADECVDDLMQVHLNRPISEPAHLIISSEGGDVSGAMAIESTISLMRRDSREVRAHVAGVAHSAAFDILQLCDHRSAEPVAFIMLHEEQYGSEGSTSANLTEAQYSKRQVASFLRVVSERTGKSVEFYQRKIKNANWYLSADEALAEGLLDEIIAIPAFKPVSVSPAKPRRRRRQTGGEVA